MRKLSRLFALALFVFAATTTFALPPRCEAGLGVYSPISGEIADCLEGGGEDCMRCWGTVIAQ